MRANCWSVNRPFPDLFFLDFPISDVTIASTLRRPGGRLQQMIGRELRE
jgi:hypothetical protein